MSAENKATVRRLIEEGFNGGDLSVFDELVAPSFVNHDPPPGVPPTREGWKQLSTGFRAAFPDMHIHIEEEIAEGDLVTSRFVAHGTHQGELMGIPATGKEVTVSGINIALWDLAGRAAGQHHGEVGGIRHDGHDGAARRGPAARRIIPVARHG